MYITLDNRLFILIIYYQLKINLTVFTLVVI